MNAAFCCLDMDSFYSSAMRCSESPIVLNDGDVVISSPRMSKVIKWSEIRNVKPDAPVVYVTHRQRDEFRQLLIEVYRLLNAHVADRVRVIRIDSMFFRARCVEEADYLGLLCAERIDLPLSVGVGNSYKEARMQCEHVKAHKRSLWSAEERMEYIGR